MKSGGSLNELLQKDETYYAPFNCIIACDHDFMTLSIINTSARFATRPFYAAGIHGFYGYIFADLFAHEYVVEREKSNRATPFGPETITRSVLSVTDRKENNGKIMEMVKKNELYCPLILANSSPLPLDVVNNRRKVKAVPALLPCLRALWDFQRNYSRYPEHNQQDLITFTTLATEKSRELQLPPETLRSDFLRSFIQNIGAEIVPTAAFIGGRLSEDVINVLSCKEQPIQNFALFDGDALDGRIYSLYSPPPEMALAMNGMAMDMGMGMPIGNGSGVMDMGMNGTNGIGLSMPMTDANVGLVQPTQAMTMDGSVPLAPTSTPTEASAAAAEADAANGAATEAVTTE